MRNILILICLLALTSNSFGQKLYVWCPNEQLTTPRQGFLQNDTIDLVIFDSRVFTAKSKVECTSENTIYELQKIFKQTYPSAVINILSTSDYYKDPKPNRITFKINISAYYVALGSDIKSVMGTFGGEYSYGMIVDETWNAITAYTVKIYDYRNNLEIKTTKDIFKISSKSNFWGKIDAKDCLNASYIDANKEMLLFIDDTLIK